MLHQILSTKKTPSITPFFNDQSKKPIDHDQDARDTKVPYKLA